MMMQRTHLAKALLFSLALAWHASVTAAFITDKIEVEVYAQPLGQGAKLATLSSGASVEVLTSDGEYARILTKDNLTGWIEARYLSEVKPARTDLQALEKKNRDQTAELKATKEKLAKLQKAGLSNAELKKLRKNAKDAGWLRAELKKARSKIKTLEKSATATQTQSSGIQQELEQLRLHNADLEQRLAATLLINEQQQTAEMVTAPETDTANSAGQASSIVGSMGNSEETFAIPGWPLTLEWFIGSIVIAIILGIILGLVWMDKRMRRRHGGFRLY